MQVLLAEDTRTIAAVLSARLASYGHQVTIAVNGQVAVEKFIELSPDLVLMDIDMPVMGGFEATNRIRAYEASRKWAWTPILFLTASDTTENLVTAIDAGGDDFMSKTVPEVVLRAKMKALKRVAALRQQLTAANHKLEEQATKDGLTGLFNRHYMDAQVDRLWAESVRHERTFGLLMVDVDNFKKYNDCYGHQIGDDCLRQIAGAIAGVVDAFNKALGREELFAVRYGGEEFAVVMPFVPASTLSDMANAVMNAVRDLAIEHERNGVWGFVTLSIGGALSPEGGKGTEKVLELFRSADARLYRAKENGRNRAELLDSAG